MGSQIEIVFEDQWLLAINKPAGMTVNRAESVKDLTIQEWAEEYLKAQGSRLVGGQAKLDNGNEVDQIFKQRGGIAHRLDKETSGLLLVTKEPGVLANLMAQFKTRQVEKQYVALVHGWVKPRLGWYQVPVGRRGMSLGKFGVRPDGKWARTDYEVIELISSKLGEYTYLYLRPKTGRTHQIRVHMHFYHHPLVADSLYLPAKQLVIDKQWCQRHFLHANKLSLKHPMSGEKLELEVDLAADLRRSLAYVKKS